MPVCLAVALEQREHEDRWERVVGKELKDWATRVMQRDGVTRQQARTYLLNKINSMDRPRKETLWAKEYRTLCQVFHTQKLDENKA